MIVSRKDRYKVWREPIELKHLRLSGPYLILRSDIPCYSSNSFAHRLYSIRDITWWVNDKPFREFKEVNL